MKSHVNLFSQRGQNQTIDKYLSIAYKATLSLFAVFIFFIIVVGAYYNYLQSRLVELSKIEQTYNKYLLVNKEFSNNLQKFVFKYQLLKSYLLTDLGGSKHYFELIQILKLRSVDDNLISFDLKLGGEITFTLLFDSFEESTDFLKFVENPKMLALFDDLQLNTFEIDFNSNSNSKSYELTFKGIIKDGQKNQQPSADEELVI